MKKLIFILITICPLSLNAKDLKTNDAIIKSKTAIAAFSCFAFNSYLNKTEETKRLFKIGYDSTIEFYKIAENYRLESEAVKKELPSIFLMISGPTPDFNAGQIFSSVVETATNSIYKDSQLNFEYDEKQRKLKAERLIFERNCALIK